MDRNTNPHSISSMILTVALRKESVDRNKYVVQCRKTLGVSLSARRAWIEISKGVKRPTVELSLSARRAWIEMLSMRNPSRIRTGRSPQGERG